MVKVKKDLTGKIFGKWKVLQQAEDYIDPKSGRHYARWLCECSCEDHNQAIVHGNSLYNGLSKSCGCLRNQKIKESCFKGNKFDISGEYGILFETNTGKEVQFDLINANKILIYTWFEDNDGYPTAKINGENVRMHVFLGYKWHDHKDRNKKNNRVSNLRYCTHQENVINRTKKDGCSSKYIGVWKDKNKWRAHITIDGCVKSIGRYNTEEEALINRLKAELKYFGPDFAPQRHLFKYYDIQNNLIAADN